MGPRTRRSLAAERKQLEARTHVSFLPSLDPSQALEVMRTAAFCHARYGLLRENAFVGNLACAPRSSK
jgi:hypothetical protein